MTHIITGFLPSYIRTPLPLPTWMFSIFVYVSYCSQNTLWSLNKFICPNQLTGKKMVPLRPWCPMKQDFEIWRKFEISLSSHPWAYGTGHKVITRGGWRINYISSTYFHILPNTYGKIFVTPFNVSENFIPPPNLQSLTCSNGVSLLALSLTIQMFSLV
jgi:hypothetical protein